MAFISETPSPALAAVQARVAVALAHGISISKAAEVFHLHRSTIYRWYKSDDNFRLAVFQGRAEYTLELRDRLRDLSVRALDTLQQVLDNPRTPQSVRARTAMYILNRPELPTKSWSMPVPVLEPEENELLDDNPLIAEDYRHIHADEPPECDKMRQDLNISPAERNPPEARI